MASLIGWLAYAGARKVDGTPVASGKAYFYQPGTTATAAVVYADKDALTALSQPVQLDASGRAAVYAKDAVRVEVQDSTAAVITVQDRGNTVAAAQVEIENTAATGTDLVTGSQVAGGRTDLNSFMTNFRTSFNAPDALVNVDGTNRTLVATLQSSLVGAIFNVKSTAYGAKGDGVTNDQAAIQAAITAAAVSGGIVYFPPGTYLCNGQLSITGKVQLWGAQANVVTIKQGSNATNTLNVTGNDVEARSITFDANGTTSGALTANAVDLRFFGCDFTQPTSNRILDFQAAAQATFTGCRWTLSQTGAKMMAVGDLAYVSIVGGRIVMSAAVTDQIQGRTGGVASGYVMIEGCAISYTAGAGTASLFDNTSGTVPYGSLTGGVIHCVAGGTLNIHGTTAANINEVGNAFFRGGTIELNSGNLYSLDREYRKLRTSTSGTSYTPDALKYRVHELVASGAAMTINNPTGTLRDGAELVIRYKNTNAGAVTPAFGAGYKVGTAPSIATNSAAGWLFTFDSNLNAWCQVGGNSSAYAS